VPVGRAIEHPSAPYLVAAKDALWLAWKESTAKDHGAVMMSRDNGLTWSAPNVCGRDADAIGSSVVGDQRTTRVPVVADAAKVIDSYRWRSRMKKWLWLALSTLFSLPPR